MTYEQAAELIGMCEKLIDWRNTGKLTESSNKVTKEEGTKYN